VTLFGNRFDGGPIVFPLKGFFFCLPKPDMRIGTSQRLKKLLSLPLDSVSSNRFFFPWDPTSKQEGNPVSSSQFRPHFLFFFLRVTFGGVDV